MRFLGTPPIPGVFADYHVFAAQQCVPIPDNISYEAAATLEPLAVGLHAVNLSRMHPGDRVAVLGCGPVGILTAMVARAAGASFIAMTDPLAARRKKAQLLVADCVVDSSDDNRLAFMEEAAGEFDVTFEAAGEQVAVDDATLLVRPAGVCVIIGIPAVERISLLAHQQRRKELNLIMARRSNLALEPALRMIDAELLDPEAIVTHRFTLEQLATGMELVHHHGDGGTEGYGLLARRLTATIHPETSWLEISASVLLSSPNNRAITASNSLRSNGLVKYTSAWTTSVPITLSIGRLRTVRIITGILRVCILFFI